MGSNDVAHQIVKGKRSKRQRSSSPYKAVTSSSSNGCSGGGGGGEFVSGEYNSNSGSISSPTTYSGIYDSTEEEEEDMANCLILLAQGEGPTPTVENISTTAATTTDRAEKRSARKFTGRVAKPKVTGTGFYVYECKTCNRSFPSFQALGGHRASHKKPKATAEEKKALLVMSMNDHHVDDEEEDDDDDDCQLNKSNLDDPICFQISSSSSNNNNNNNKGFHGNKAKIHECSICGSEFASGQALGGHMRRHRASTANLHMSATNSSREIKARNILPLDLNLPAPEDDHPHLEFETSYQFASKQQALVFPAPALVDCHY